MRSRDMMRDLHNANSVIASVAKQSLTQRYCGRLPRRFTPRNDQNRSCTNQVSWPNSGLFHLFSTFHTPSYL